MFCQSSRTIGTRCGLHIRNYCDRGETGVSDSQLKDTRLSLNYEFYLLLSHLSVHHIMEIILRHTQAQPGFLGQNNPFPITKMKYLVLLVLNSPKPLDSSYQM